MVDGPASGAAVVVFTKFARTHSFLEVVAYSHGVLNWFAVGRSGPGSASLLARSRRGERTINVRTIT